MKYVKRIFAVAVILATLASFTFGVCAADKADDWSQWTLSEDETNITYEGVAYDRYELPFNTWFRPKSLYVYEQDLGYYVNVARPILSEGHNDEILCQDVVLLYEYSGIDDLEAMYVSKEGKAIMDRFAQGEYARYELFTSYSSGKQISEKTVDRWNGADSNTSVDVTQLAGEARYEILGYDETLTVAHVVGAVFEVDETYLYIYYDVLENQYFNSDGSFSFRKGTVSALILDQEDASWVETAIEEANEGEDEWRQFTYESEESEPLDPVGSMVIMLFLLSPLMFVLPVILLVMSLVLSFVREIPGRGRWRRIAILSASWLLLSLIITIFLMIAVLVM